MADSQLQNTIIDELASIIERRSISVMFQQIIDVKHRRILGYEALTRGPSDSSLHSPLVLFEAAFKHGKIVQLEMIALEMIVTEFSRQELPGILFVNTSSYTLLRMRKHMKRIISILESVGIEPNRIVVELTETHPVFSQEELELAMEEFRRKGFGIALDDLGEGFASLKRWSVMKPDYVKIDRHFIEGISRDAVKQQFIKSVIDIARVSNARVIAEGVEQVADLIAIRSIGIRLVQGFLVARPEPHPLNYLSSHTDLALTRGMSREVADDPSTLKPPKTCAGDLVAAGRWITCEDPLMDALKLFQEEEILFSLPVLDAEKRPLGLIRSMDLLTQASRPYFHEIYHRRTCHELMDPYPLIFDRNTDLRTMSEQISDLSERKLMDGFIVTQDGKYLGTGKVTDLIKAVSDQQIFAARYANPLTFLPGNVPIDERIASLLDRKQDFVIVYWDLNDFKPYNDVYGYGAGDEVIKATAEILGEIIDDERDFLGHIGGDDFVTIFLSDDWEDRIKDALRLFETAVPQFIQSEHLVAGGYYSRNRKGRKVKHDTLSLAAGALRVQSGIYEYPSQISQAVTYAKKQAKKLDGSGYFIERRKDP